jgi:zinc/manganese transport system substrate-binding protein
MLMRGSRCLAALPYVTSLIGPDSGAHVFKPNPDQARLLAKAQLFLVNGLGFEGSLTRLTRSAQFGGLVVTVTDAVAPDHDD